MYPVLLSQGILLSTSILYLIQQEYSMDQPVEVADPARGQLKREDEYFPVRVVRD